MRFEIKFDRFEKGLTVSLVSRAFLSFGDYAYHIGYKNLRAYDLVIEIGLNI
ncbi:hypothetical protein ABET51_08445 [Metabacillus fastidiosus]|uniref:hypothetical protein n=1 Tax=Metabacillus fastidiosus TaxID=1458 RepID=UPI003D2E49D5